MKFTALIILVYFILSYVQSSFAYFLGEMLMSILSLVYMVGVYYLMFLFLRGSLRWFGRHLNHGK